MGFGFRKSVRLGKGVRLNLSKSGIGISGGVKGLRVGMNSKGSYLHSSIPGTGIYSRKHFSNSGGGGGTASGGSGKSCLLMIWIFIVFICTFVAPPLGLIGWAVTGYGFWKYSKTAKYQNEKAKKVIGKRDLAEARKILEAIEEPDSETVFLLGLVDYGEDKFKDAISRFSSLESEGKVSLNAFVYPYADSLKRIGRLGDAIKVLQSIVKNDEQNVQLLNLLASCFVEEGKHELAIETLKKAPTRKKNLDENLLETLYRLGVSNEAIGKNSNAKRFYNRVYAHDASYEDVAARLEGLG